MKRRTILAVALCIVVGSVIAQTDAELNAWTDVNIYEINKLYPRTNVIPIGEEWSQRLNKSWNFRRPPTATP